ncbi:MAG: PLP-dependent aminotransferase family protein [Mesorhizobium sp.]|nr:MAG: PLP-dependent aminotransferase family protein [Mesorhizobium sp.]TIW23548.1 MAG: PLP-dependent aminotransferase family protein [Mesorhizobium sp.]
MAYWRPDPAHLRRPAYLSLAEQIATAIRDGRLTAGTRLWPHRKLAHSLNLSVQTISRAYNELIQRGLISAKIGRGSFVQMLPKVSASPYLPERFPNLIDLSILEPICEQIHFEKMRQALRWLSVNLASDSAMSLRPITVLPHHRLVGAEWLACCGLNVSPLNISLTNGATPGLMVALMSAAPPGSSIATEVLSLHTLVPLSSYLGLRLQGLVTDEEGMIPEALDEACRKGPVRAVFLEPSVINPLAALMSETRRRQLADVAARHDVAIIESDVLGPLVEDRAPPIAAFAPDRTIYITSFTKITLPGLRLGYLVTPDRYVAAAANRHLVANWTATPAIADIATLWVRDGTALELVKWQREALNNRHSLAAKMLSGLSYNAHPQSLHLWLPLSRGHTEYSFVSQVRLGGVMVAPGSSFRTTDRDGTPAVRISLGSTTEGELRAGLEIVASSLRGTPEPLVPVF